ncbi:MAG: phospho-sugar mutase [Actinobacteria bacterium]|nr:phospho-sugar mutase [Actinomycetota bacterium]
MMERSGLLAQVRAWIDIDPDPETRAEAHRLMQRTENGDASAADRLHEAFAGRLKFGTAGLRAELGAGPCRMNRVVVAQTTAGLAAFLHRRAADAAQDAARHSASDRLPYAPSVVIGYDGRVNSEVFARDAAEVLRGAGIAVTLLPGPLPTPVIAFAVRHLGTSAGVMITASHNPPRDNGYKVYLGGSDDGRQICSPQDREIAAAILSELDRLGPVPPRATDYTVAGTDIAAAYVTATAAAVRDGLPRDGFGDPQGGIAPPNDEPGELLDPAAEPRVVYTAMHGVGADIARAVFAAAALPEVIAVPQQDRPDGAFPTLRYPNPEEPDALELAFALARTRRAHFVLANDPDADRLALAAPHPDEPSGYRRLSGNQLGLLLGHRAALRARDLHTRVGVPLSGTLANTIVSSPALGALARHYALDHAETLPGFKWVSRVPGLIFGYEESIGYLTTPAVVGDKDGISAAAETLALVRELHRDGRTVWQQLDALSEMIGHFASTQIILRRDRMAEVEALSAWVRANPPGSFGELEVTRIRDFRAPGLAPVKANVLAYDLADGSRVMIRPSGTEPKLKVYLDAFSDVGSVQDRQTTTAHLLRSIETSVRSYLAGALSDDAGAPTT